MWMCWSRTAGSTRLRPPGSPTLESRSSWPEPPRGQLRLGQVDVGKVVAEFARTVIVASEPAEVWHPLVPGGRIRAEQLPPVRPGAELLQPLFHERQHRRDRRLIIDPREV